MPTEIDQWILIACLLALLIVQDIIHKQERKDLYNRIMARDFPEYKGGKPRAIKNILRKNFSKQQKRNTPR